MSTGWTDEAYAAIAGLVEARSGLTFAAAGRQPDAEAGIRRAMTRAGFPGVQGYAAHLALDARAIDALVDELTVHETYFFREPEHFEQVRRELLGAPARLARGVRAWSAGCASGEEAYSLAILFEELGVSLEVPILATDLSRAVLARAEQAAYRPWSFRRVDPAIVARWFEPSGALRRPLPEVRRRVRFERLNLVRDVFPSHATRTVAMDLIFCRNVLIYLEPEAIQGIARRFYDALVPGGCLFVGASDPPLGAFAPFEAELTSSGLVYRRPRDEPGAREAWPAASPALAEAAASGVVAPRPRAAVAASCPAVAASCPAPTPGESERPRREARADAEPSEALRRVRRIAEREGLEAAARACAQAVSAHPLSAALQYFAAVVALGLFRDDDALAALRRAIYLDRGLAMAHFTLGTLHQRAGELGAARRAYRNARDLCLAVPADEPLPLGDGERAGTLAREAERQLAALDALLGRAEDE